MFGRTRTPPRLAAVSAGPGLILQAAGSPVPSRHWDGLGLVEDHHREPVMEPPSAGWKGVGPQRAGIDQAVSGRGRVGSGIDSASCSGPAPLLIGWILAGVAALVAVVVLVSFAVRGLSGVFAGPVVGDPQTNPSGRRLSCASLPRRLSPTRVATGW